MFEPITVSINPSYFCNFRCDFCYLTEKQLGDTTKINPTRLDMLLCQIPKIGYVDLYGGEIGALKKEYFYTIKHVIKQHYHGKINIITNYSMLHDGFFDDDIHLTVSFDFEAREKSERVFSNMLVAPVPISVLVLASPAVLNMDIDYMIALLNSINSVVSVEIKPYSINQSNAYNVPHDEFERFVKAWIDRTDMMKFQFINADNIERSLAGEYNAFSDNHVYITPNGKFGVLEFDHNDREFFLELDSWDEYLGWADREKVGLSPICQTCKYNGRCLTEHYRYVRDLDHSCNGYRNLLDWYNERMANTTRNISSSE